MPDNSEPLEYKKGIEDRGKDTLVLTLTGWENGRVNQVLTSQARAGL